MNDIKIIEPNYKGSTNFLKQVNKLYSIAGNMWGHGSYDYCRQKWNYYFVGRIEQCDNAITHWKQSPEIPKER